MPSYTISDRGGVAQTWFGGSNSISLDPAPGTGSSYTLSGTSSSGTATNITLNSNYTGSYDGDTITLTTATGTALDGSITGSDQTTNVGCIEASG